VRVLAPLTYPLYLLHIPTAMYFYWIFYDTEEAWWWKVAGMKIIPLPWYAYFCSILVSLLIAAFLQTFCVAPLLPRFLKCIGCLCCIEPLSQTSTYDKVTVAIRTLTGSDVDKDTPLNRIGVDSFGTVALIGSLRASIPHASKLSVSHFYKLGTIADLVSAIEILGGRDKLSDKIGTENLS